MPAVVWLTNHPPAFKSAKTKREVKGNQQPPGGVCSSPQGRLLAGAVRSHQHPQTPIPAASQ